MRNVVFQTMSGKIINFGTEEKLPQRVYLDTSFVIKLFSYVRQREPNEKADPKVRISYDQYQTLVKHGTSMFISDFVVEECINFLLTEEMRKEANKLGWNRIKKYKRTNPDEYKRLFKKCINKVRIFLDWLRDMRLNYIPMVCEENEEQYHQKFYEMVYIILRDYHVDTFDAFHVVIALLWGIDWVVTLDRDFEDISIINKILYSEN